MVIFIDDILIYFVTQKEHKDHLKIVLPVLQEKKLFAKLSKCDSWMTKVKFLGHFISKWGVEGDLSKVEIVINWERPKNNQTHSKGSSVPLGFRVWAKFYRVEGKINHRLLDPNKPYEFFCDAS